MMGARGRLLPIFAFFHKRRRLDFFVTFGNFGQAVWASIVKRFWTQLKVERFQRFIKDFATRSIRTRKTLVFFKLLFS
jgi:hypothetical protein